ncbi:MAG: alkaline phosphatase family protein [Planctomycetota bacterium]|jgi:predicted AlkP superfamily phosphohydrolase/phosphomutase
MAAEFRKVFVLGLDGATFDIIDPLIAKGQLPNLGDLIRQGCGQELLSTIHPYSAPAWSSFMTGMNPGKHGIVDFTQHIKSEYKLKFLNASHRQGKSLWRVLSDHGKRVGVVNVPFTYPPEKVNGFMISGMDAPSTNSDFTYPKELSGEIAARVGEYVIEVGVKDYIAKGRPKDFLREIKHAFELQMKTLEYLIDNKPWDFFVYVCRLTDQVQHYFWKYFDPQHPFYEEEADGELKDAIACLYRRIDSTIGSLMASLGEDVNVIVVSDHGQGGINGKKVFLNKWLSSEGFLTFSEKKETTARRVFGCISRKRKGEFIDLIRKVIPKGVRTVLVDRAPMLKDKLISHEAFSNIDWEKTQAYSDEKRGNVWINVKGCQQKGIVAPGEEYENLRGHIIAKLKDLRDPETDEPMFSEIFRKEELYHGPYLEKAPDIVLTEGNKKYSCVFRRSRDWKNKALWMEPLNQDEAGKLPNASHRLEGILIMKGRNIRKRGRVRQPVSIMDVAPTVLYMMGLPVPEEMDGKVLLDVFTNDYLTYHEVTYVMCEDGEAKEKERLEYSEEEEEMISERLRQLGYF